MLANGPETRMARLLEGGHLAQKLLQSIRHDFAKIGGHVAPRLAIIKANDRPDTDIYVERKKQVLQDLGFSCDIHVPRSVQELFSLARRLNSDRDVHGILIQQPIRLDREINPAKVYSLVQPWKDVDALNPVNVGFLATLGSSPVFLPCTAAAVLHLLDHYGIQLEGRRVCIVGRSAIVGMPLFHLLTRRHATVTLCHSKTVNLPDHLRHAEIVVVAIGQASFVQADWLHPGAVVVDVGINETPDGVLSASGRRLCGDVDFERACRVACAITPVPGGVGPLTVAMLARNLLEAFRIQQTSTGRGADHNLPSLYQSHLV